MHSMSLRNMQISKSEKNISCPPLPNLGTPLIIQEDVSEKYRKVIGIGFSGYTDTLKLTRHPILRVLGIGFVPSLDVCRQ